MERLLISCIFTFMATIIAILSVRPLAIRIGLIDIPDTRKKHYGKIPLIGGVCMLFGLGVGILSLDISLVQYRFLLIAIGILAFAGILDDFHELSPYKKLVIQFLVSFLIIFFGKLSINNLGNLLFYKPILLGYLSIPFTVLGTVALINAINMTDGIDGLAGTVLFIQFSFLAILSYHLKLDSDFKIIILTLSVLFAFLWFNFPYKRKLKNKIFMGDVGSMTLGLLLAWLLISIAKKANQDFVPVSLLWVIALPIYDMLLVIIVRLKNKKLPFIAGREHLHFLFKKANFSDTQIVMIFLCLSVIFGLVGYFGFKFQLSESWMFLTFLVTFLIYLLFARFLFISLKNK
ncbi:MAG: undecaprenyl/decaprenyl-phosphate alpha-N-acetylglucosaminyl 1-phosphate transferase [Gammaproteobacteria bacterium]|nr:undecaprenyl/decaprenyl-phosphate alpha-N-acetylglucosaminyl 1-phosphate transferase [Gammaproteobacteria bacterium]